MSQCTKKPCPHKPAIQEGITENPKKEEREKIGKKPTPRSTNKNRKHQGVPHTSRKNQVPKTAQTTEGLELTAQLQTKLPNRTQAQSEN